MKKILILDTNIIYNDFHFSDPHISTISRLASTLDLRLCLPKVIYLEVLNKYKSLLSIEINKASTAVAQISKRFKVEYEQKHIDIDVQVQNYREFLNAKFLSPNIILDFPNISHEVLTQKAIDRRKPFKDNGTGYRDALIWENIIQCLENNDQVFFVTNNTKDFFEGDGLHNDLRSEITRYHENFRIFNDVKGFFTTVVQPQLQIIDSIKDKFSSNTLDGVDTNKLIQEIEAGIGNLNIGSYLADNNDFSSYQVVGHLVERGEIDDVWLLDDSECYINYFYLCTIVAEYFVDKFEAYGNEFSPYTIVDDDWNEHVVLVSIPLEIRISASLIYSIREKQIVRFDYELAQ